MPVESIIADVELPILHPLDLDGSVLDIKVVAEKVLFGGVVFPVELARDLVPEGVGVLHRLLVQLLVLFHRAAVGLLPEELRRAVHVRHGRPPANVIT